MLFHVIPMMAINKRKPYTLSSLHSFFKALMGHNKMYTYHLILDRAVN